MILRRLALGFALASSMAMPAGATPVVDQVSDQPSGGTGLGIGSTSLGQTFTVGITGTLAAVEIDILKFGGTVDVRADIRPVSLGRPDQQSASALAVTAIANSAIQSAPGFGTILVDFGFAGLHVAAGDELAFVLSAPIGHPFSIETDYDGNYLAGGRCSQADPTAPFTCNSAIDLTFRTFVEAAEIAAPGGLAPIAAAALVLLLRRIGPGRTRSALLRSVNHPAATRP